MFLKKNILKLNYKNITLFKKKIENLLILSLLVN